VNTHLSSPTCHLRRIESFFQLSCTTAQSTSPELTILLSSTKRARSLPITATRNGHIFPLQYPVTSENYPKKRSTAILTERMNHPQLGSTIRCVGVEAHRVVPFPHPCLEVATHSRHYMLVRCSPRFCVTEREGPSKSRCNLRRRFTGRM
jgi:hypothetical protein